MENRSHSAALWIMYGTDMATRLWTTGGPSHVPVKPFGYVLGITHVSWWFTKHLYLALRLQGHKMFNPSLSIESQLCPFSAWAVHIKPRSYHKGTIPAGWFPSCQDRNYTLDLSPLIQELRHFLWLLCNYSTKQLLVCIVPLCNEGNALINLDTSGLIIKN